MYVELSDRREVVSRSGRRHVQGSAAAAAAEKQLQKDVAVRKLETASSAWSLPGAYACASL
jgi:hypothetical protein